MIDQCFLVLFSFVTLLGYGKQVITETGLNILEIIQLMKHNSSEVS